MKKVFKIVIGIFIFTNGIRVNAQQQTLFTNYLLNSYAYNSGVVGSSPYLQANIYYRNQWSGFEGAPKTYLMSMYGPIKKLKKAAVGGMIMADQTGLMSSNTGYLTFAYHVKLNKKLKLGAGLSGGLRQYRIKLYDVRAYDQGDELLTGNLLTSNTFDANAGLYLYSENFFLGVSSMNMLNNKIKWSNSQGKLTPHYYAVIGYNYHFQKDYAVQPSILLKYNEPAPMQMEYSLKISYKDMVWVGASYREKDALGTMVGFTLIKKLNVAYSYDFSLSTIKRYQQGSHEISLSYKFIKKKGLNSADEEEFKIIDNSVRQNLKNKKENEPDGNKKTDETQGAPPKKETKTIIKVDENKNEESKPNTPND